MQTSAKTEIFSGIRRANVSSQGCWDHMILTVCSHFPFPSPLHTAAPTDHLCVSTASEMNVYSCRDKWRNNENFWCYLHLYDKNITNKRQIMYYFVKHSVSEMFKCDFLNFLLTSLLEPECHYHCLINTK